MHCYETTYILHPDLGETAEPEAKARVDAIIDGGGGCIYHRENWGRKRLAYPIRKQPKGIYQVIRFTAEAEALLQLERLFRLDEAYLKYLTIRCDGDPDSVTPVPAAEVESASAPAPDGAPKKAATADAPKKAVTADAPAKDTATDAPEKPAEAKTEAAPVTEETPA